MDRLNEIPGVELIRPGLEHLARRQESVESLLVSIGSPRLQRCGIAVPDPFPDADHRLYQLLSEQFGDDAHSRYNALLRRLVSFEHALECAT